MAEKFVRASKLFNRFLKLTLGRYMRRLFNFKINNDQIVNLKPPYIVLANHTNNWDPFLLSMCFPEPVYFVTSDTHFRSRILRYLLKLVGAIPKTKFVSDPSATRDIFNIVKHGGIIGIFPEGRRSWDGKTLPLIYPTAKLIKSLGLPVVKVLFKGACLSMPRWARKPRKGELTMECSILLNSAKLAEMTVDDVFNYITTGLAYDEYEWQRTAMIPFRGEAIVERLELFLFCCPDCSSIGTMKSSKASFGCNKCGYAVEYDDYGFINKKHGRLHFDNTSDWNLWQLEYMESLISSALDIRAVPPVFEDQDILAQTGGRLKPLKRLETGKLSMHIDKIVFTGDEGIYLEFPLKKIYGENIQSNRKFEFYHEKVLYRFTGNSYCLPAYKWVKAVEISKKLAKLEAIKNYE